MKRGFSFNPRSSRPATTGIAGRRSREFPAFFIGILAVLAACVQVPHGGSGGEETPDQPGHVASDSSRVLELRFLDVGQGDAVLVRNGGRVALIDAGPSDAIVDRLRQLGVDSIDLLVASHNHADHIGGADALLQGLPVRFYLDNGFPASTRIQQRVLEEVERTGTTYLNATPRTIELGDAALHILPAPAGVGDDDEQNNRSTVVLVERDDFSALLTGDSEIEEINALLAADAVPDVDVLKAAHHGSRDAVTPAWLARTRPEVVVISLGADNRYGHPHAAAMRYYCASGRRVLRTDQAGDVVIRVAPGGAYRVSTSRDANASSASANGGACAGYSVPTNPGSRGSPYSRR